MMEYLSPERIRKMAHEPQLPALAQKVLALQTSDKFRLAAELLDAGKPGLAETVGTRACQEITLAELLCKEKPQSI